MKVKLSGCDSSPPWMCIYILSLISNNIDCSMDACDFPNHIKHYVCLLHLQQALIRAPMVLLIHCASSVLLG